MNYWQRRKTPAFSAFPPYPLETGRRDRSPLPKSDDKTADIRSEGPACLSVPGFLHTWRPPPEGILRMKNAPVSDGSALSPNGCKEVYNPRGIPPRTNG